MNDATLGYLVVLAYVCLPAVSGEIAHFQAVVKFRTKQRLFKDDTNIDMNKCGHGSEPVQLHGW